MTGWPDWWFWELEFSVHLLKRMVDRGFNEIDLRHMLEEADGFRPDIEDGRWIIETTHASSRGEVIVEPLASELRLLANTAYPVG